MARSREHTTSDTIPNGIGDLGLQPIAAAEQFVPGQVPLGSELLANPESINMTPPNSYSTDGRTPSILVNAERGIFNSEQPLETTLHPTHLDENNTTQASIGTALWSTQLDIDCSPLFAGDDFDLDAMNLSILQATSQSIPAMENAPRQNTTDLLGPLKSPPDRRPASLVQRKWHTFSEKTPSGHTTPTDTQERVSLDEDYRQRLAESLGQRVQNGILPSTLFLVRFSHCSALDLNT